MMYEGDNSPASILAWLEEGGYSCVLYYDGKRAHVVDEDDDYGRQRVPVRPVRKLVADGKIAVWREHGNGMNAYRPAIWVAAWNTGWRPWDHMPVPELTKRLRQAGYVSFADVIMASRHGKGA